MTRPQNIRNISVISLRDHGKSVLVDELSCRSGVCKKMDYPHYIERVDSGSRDMIHYNKAISQLYFEYNVQTREKPIRVEKPIDLFINEHSHLINVVLPDNIDAGLTNLSTKLSVVDGAIVVVDVVEGWGNYGLMSPIHTLIDARVRPVLFVNKMDRVLLELQLTGEAIYRQCFEIVHTVNGFTTSSDPSELAWTVEPIDGSVVFGSALHGWGFTLRTFALMYASKFGTTVEKMTEKLWGDWVFATNNGNPRWFQSQTVTTNNGIDIETGSKRSFSAFILEPIMSMFAAVMDNKLNKKGIPKAYAMAQNIGVILTDHDKLLTGKVLLKLIMRKWLSLSDAILETAVVHLPSPPTAQKYRTELMYDGPLDDVTAIALTTCDASDEAPLMIHVYGMIYRPGTRLFTAFVVKSALYVYVHHRSTVLSCG